VVTLSDTDGRGTVVGSGLGGGNTTACKLDSFWAGSQNCERRLLAPSVRPSTWNNSAPTGRIFMEFGICLFLENLPRILKFITI
jgi:hypothetical protein